MHLLQILFKILSILIQERISENSEFDWRVITTEIETDADSEHFLKVILPDFLSNCYPNTSLTFFHRAITILLTSLDMCHPSVSTMTDRPNNQQINSKSYHAHPLLYLNRISKHHLPTSIQEDKWTHVVVELFLRSFM